MIQKSFNMEQSPFFIERNLETTRNDETIQTRISNDTWEDLQQYLNQRYGTLEKVKSKFAYDLIVNFLNSIALDKWCFKDSYVIMLFPNTTNLQELRENSQIIGFVKSDEQISDFNNFKVSTKNEYNFISCLKRFDETTFEMLNLENLSKNALFNIDKEIQHDFIQVKQRLSELYKSIDVEDCFISIFNLNNYLDVLKEGQYVSRHSMFEHEGLIVLLLPDNPLNRINARIVWCYTEGDLSLTFNIEDEATFMNETIYQTNNEVLITECLSIGYTETRLAGLKRKLSFAKANKSYYENKIVELEHEIEKEEKTL